MLEWWINSFDKNPAWTLFLGIIVIILCYIVYLEHLKIKYKLMSKYLSK